MFYENSSIPPLVPIVSISDLKTAIGELNKTNLELSEVLMTCKDDPGQFPASDPFIRKLKVCSVNSNDGRNILLFLIKIITTS